MRWNAASLQAYLYAISVFILLAGLGGAVWIHQSAEADSHNDTGYEIVGGYIYSASPGNTKKYSHDLELYGGKAAVLADRFSRWYSGLWHGKSLAVTVACIALLLSTAVFLVARHVSFRVAQDNCPENRGDGTN